MLASGSADTTVRLWDLAGNHHQSVLALRHHTDKVPAIAWHTTEHGLLLTASYDKRACVVDVRSPGSVRSWELGAEADPEAVAWDPHSTHLFSVALEDGTVRCFDARSPGEAVWSLKAHKRAVSSLDYNVRPRITIYLSLSYTSLCTYLYKYIYLYNAVRERPSGRLRRTSAPRAR